MFRAFALQEIQMSLPDIDPAGVQALIPLASEITEIGRGGQKIVFRAVIDDEPQALKFLLLGKILEDDEEETISVQARADREVSIMRDCVSPHMVKLGPIGLEVAVLGNQRLLYFSEELIEGPDLAAAISIEPLDTALTIELGLQIGDAISELWKIGKVHRDIKPGNIMRRSNGTFVLLDAGLAFDTRGESISVGAIVGTFAFCSPEQFDYSNRRGLDFRTDQFSLGVTMYLACTGQHPFMQRGMNMSAIYSGIMNHEPPPPSTINPTIPAELDEIVLRMLGKSPHLRFRKMDQLLDSLRSLKG